jgi:hypothetical protein
MNLGLRRFIYGILLSVIFFSNNIVLFVLAYVFTFLAMVVYTLLKVNGTGNKILFILIYLAIMVFQLFYNAQLTFSETHTGFASVSGRFGGTIILFIPFVIQGFVSRRNRKFYFPSVQDISVFTFNELVEDINTVGEIVNKGRQSLSNAHINELLQDMPRHNSFRYINKGSLTEDYFNIAYQTLNDLNIYIIVSNTGSPASEIISLFTQKQYNHASLSFDKNLETIISYNGGERVYPPGLNMEMLQYFNHKKDSSIIVYSIQITSEKKKEIIDTINEINNQGNAYNILGLVFKFSFKPNIMFCSQFVYKMLKMAGVHYFEKKDWQIKPTDLIELDYYRKLKYEYEIKFDK